MTLTLTFDLVLRIFVSQTYLLYSLRYHFGVTVTLTSDLVSRIGISSIFFEVGIQKFVCGCFLGWPSVAYHFGVIVTLTSDLVFRIIMFEAFFLYYGKCSKISNTLKLRTPKIITENNF